MKFKDFMDYGINQGASDLHIVTGIESRIRLYGRLKTSPYIFSKGEIQEAIDYVLDQGELERLLDQGSIDKALAFRDWRLRIHIFRQNLGYSLAIRVIPGQIPSLDQLNLPGAIADLGDFKSGLLLITGSTGMGKTTTLASLVDHINRRQSRHIISLENPIEYVYESKKSLIQQREVYRDLVDYESGIRSVVRQDPDIIVLGEIRDRASIKTALSLAELGHLVISTIHTRSAPATIGRIIDVFPEGEKEEVRIQLASSLRAIVNQELVALDQGQLPICELMVMNKAMENIIRENKNLDSIRDQMLINSGPGACLTRGRHVKNLISCGKISIDKLETSLSREDYEEISGYF